MNQQVQPQPREFRAFVCDSKHGPVIRAGANAQFEIARALASMGFDFELAQSIAGEATKQFAVDSAATSNQMANAGNVSGLNAGVAATVEGTSPRQPGEGTDSGMSPESMQGTIAMLKQILAVVEAVAAERATANGASTEDYQGWGGEGEATQAANATGESYDEEGRSHEQTAPSLQNPNNAIAQRLDEDTEQGMDGAAMSEAANMLEQMGAHDSAFEVRSLRQRANILNGLQSRSAIYAAGVRSAMDVKPGASQDAAEAAMRAAGIEVPRRGYEFARG